MVYDSYFQCAGTAEVSVQIGGLMPFHGLPFPFQREMCSPKLSMKDLQGSELSHRLTEYPKLEGTCIIESSIF